ncbi:unnamed protein product, partial [Symbiodinium sp. CCMP2592]
DETVDVVVEGRETLETSAVDMEVDPTAPVPQSTTRATVSIEERRQGSEVVNDSISLSSDVVHKKTKVKCKAKVKKKVEKPIDEISPAEETVDVVVEGRETVETSAVDMEVDPTAPVPQSTTRATASIEERRQGSEVVNDSISLSSDVVHKKTKVKCKAKVKKKVEKPIDEISPAEETVDVVVEGTRASCAHSSQPTAARRSPIRQAVELQVDPSAPDVVHKKTKVKKKVNKPIDDISPEGHLVIDVSDTMSSEMVEGAISLEEVAFEEAISFSAPGDLPWHSHVHGDRGDISGTQAPEQKYIKKIPQDKVAEAS